MYVIPIISASGGVGKTTISLLIAYILVKYAQADPRRLLIVDLDPTAGLSLRVLGDEGYDEACRNRKTLYHMDLDFGIKNINIKDYVNQPGRSAKALSNVSILPPGEDDRGDLASRIEDWFRYGRRERLKDLLNGSGASSQYDYVIIDTAPFFDARYTVAALSASNWVVVPLRPTVTDIRRSIRMVNTLRKHGLEITPVFLFNFDKDRFVKEASTLSEMGFRVPKSKRTNPDRKLGDMVSELERLGIVVRSIVAHYKDLSDAKFPYDELDEKVVVAVCNPIVELLNGLKISVPQCPSDYEET